MSDTKSTSSLAASDLEKDQRDAVVEAGSDAEYRQAVRRLDYAILPVTALIYLLNFLDRSNIGNAKVAGMPNDINLTSHQYLICITVTYVPYIACEIPSNLILKKVGPQRLIPTVVMAWGIVSCLTGLVQNFGGLVTARFFLGLCEGSVFPGLVLYLSMFYRRRELQSRISIFFASASISGAFSGLLAAAILNLDGVGGQEGWRWIFYLEGLFTVLFGATLYWLLPGTPSQCRFLTNRQKDLIKLRLAADTPGGLEGVDDDNEISWKEVKASLTSPHVLLLGISLWGLGFTLYALAYWIPTIVKTFGYSTVQTQLLTVPPFVSAFLVTMLTAWFSDRYGQRGLCAIAMSAIALVGYVMFYKSLLTSVRYTALFLAVTGVYSAAPALITWMPNNSSRHCRKAVSVAFGFVSTNCAGIASTWLFPAEEAPQYATASKALIAMTIVMGLFAGLNVLYLRHANAQKAIRRRERDEAGEPNEVTIAKWKEEGDRHCDFVYTY
ncbi:hypothetical protein JCM10212_002228 [Sporobolomyces blumeae]